MPYRNYSCDQCGGLFRVFHHVSDDPPPDECKLCGAPNDGTPVFVPQAPAIKGHKLAAADQVFRSMEAGSIERAELAAGIGGGSASEYAHMKITDLKDNQREGDTAYKMPANEVQGFMTDNPQAAVGSQHAAVAQQYAAQAHTGYFPHAGSRTSSVVGNIHSGMKARLTAKGQMAKG